MALLTLAMKYKTILNSIKDFLVRLTDVLVPVVSVALLLGIIFGPEAPFVGVCIQKYI